MSERAALLPTQNPPPGEVACEGGPGGDVEEGRVKSTYHLWQRRTAWFLEHRTLHKIVIILIAIDAICVLSDLAYSFLSEECAAPGGDDTPIWLEVLSRISLGITTLFLIEIPLTIWSMGFSYMNPFGPVPHAALHAFDSLIILTTFVLEIILRGKERELAGLLVILRLWRLVKLVGGVAVGAGEIQEETAERLAETRDELASTKAELVEAKQEISNLRQKLSQFATNP